MPSFKLLPDQSQPFFDNFEISFCFDMLEDKKFKELTPVRKDLIKKIFLDFCKYYERDTWLQLNKEESPHLHYHLYDTLNFFNHLKNSIYIKNDTRHYSINIQFHGSYFSKTKIWYDDFEILFDAVLRSHKRIQKRLIRYLGKESPILLTKVTKFDIAQNHYRAKVWDWEKQLFCRKDLHIAPQKNNGVYTAVYVGQKGTPYMYFRAYDKSHQGYKDRQKACLRFDTDEFCRNEWSLGAKWIKKHLTNDFFKLAPMFSKKNRSDFIQFMITKLRKVRDFTYYEKTSHKYNLIHLDGFYKKWKKPDNFINVKPKIWEPDKHFSGVLREYEGDLKISTYIEMIQYARANTGLIPEDVYNKLIKHWKNEDLIANPYYFSNID